MRKTAEPGRAATLLENDREVSNGDASPSVSVVVAVSERPAALADFYRYYSAPLRAGGWAYEFVFVAEPWFRGLSDPLRDLVREGEPIRVFEAERGVGESALLRLGAAHARGSIVVTMPAYHRVEADALPDMLHSLENGADLVAAGRSPRRDSWINRLQNRTFHLLLAVLTHQRVSDVACGVRAMRRDVFDALPLYGDFFRFLPLFALREGYRVEEVASPQHPEDARTRVHSLGTYVRRLLDLLGLFFLIRFTYKPLRFFGLVGASLSLGGALVMGVLLIQRVAGQGIANRPLLLLGVLLFVLGVQAVALGMIGEIIVYLRASQRPAYRLRGEDHGPDPARGSADAPAGRRIGDG